MDTTNEQLPDPDQEPIDTDDVACFLGFQLTHDDDLIFDAVWDNKESLQKLAQVIYLIQNSDFILSNIKEMDTENPEDIEILEKLLEEINNRPAIYPTEVFKDD